MAEFDRALAHIRRYVESRWDTLETPGLALGFTDRDRCLGVQTFGFANLEARMAVSPEHLFQIGSISKGFTAVALLQEREAGRLDLNAPVTEYLPWFEVRSAYGPITIHHLLTHTSGLIQGMDFTGEGAHEVWALRESETGFPPGERFWYSNVGFKALGLVLVTVAGQPWWEVVRERVLLPLGMTATDPITTHETRKRLAVGYVPRYDDRPWHPSHGFAPGTWVESATADGTICSTAEEMTGYVRFLLNGGAGPGGRILSEESFALMAQRVIEDPDEPGVLFGYGLNTRRMSGRTCVGHSGSTIGYSTYVLADVDAGFGVVILMNAYADRVAHVSFALETLAAAAQGDGLPPIADPVGREHVPNAAEYAGSYSSGERAFTVEAEGSRLILVYGDRRIALERLEPDGFLVPDPELDRFALRFGRAEGVVVEATHGPEWYVNERYSGPTSFLHPMGWEAFVGHYRSHNPWASNFRVVLQKGRLHLVSTFAEELGDGELVPLPDGSFRVGAREWSPDRIRFGTLIDGKATRAILDCAPFYRTFTP